MRVAVVGHVEFVEFVRLGRLPSVGDIVHAAEAWSEPAGGGAVAAGQLLKLAGEVTFFTALGDDELGRRAHAELQELGVQVEAAFRPEPQRRAITVLDDRGERTIIVIGDRMVPHLDDPLPWHALTDCDAVYVTGCDPAAVRAARAARVLVATPRALTSLRTAAVEIDVLVGSGSDEGERYRPGDLVPPPRAVVRTEGGLGGWYERADGSSRRFAAAPLPGPIADAYGCGDNFAAGLTYGLGAGWSMDDALALAARCGASALTGRGAYAGQLHRVD